mgnify:CR=1 FL=1
MNSIILYTEIVSIGRNLFRDFLDISIVKFFCRKVDVRKRIDDDEFFDEINQVIINNSYDDVINFG